jgi:hypothetical protein
MPEPFCAKASLVRASLGTLAPLAAAACNPRQVDQIAKGDQTVAVSVTTVGVEEPMSASVAEPFGQRQPRRGRLLVHALPYVVSLSLLGVDAVLPTLQHVPGWRWDIRAAWQLCLWNERPETYQWFVKHWGSDDVRAAVEARLDEAAWEKDERIGTTDSFADYIANMPHGRHVAEALAGLDKAWWTAAAKVGTELGFSLYISQFPNGQYLSDAHASLAALQWNRISRTKNAELVGDFMKSHPDYAERPDAVALLEQVIWTRARADSSNVDTLKAFIAKYPNSQHVRDAEATIQAIEAKEKANMYRTGVPLKDLLHDGVIKADISRSSYSPTSPPIQSIVMTVRNMTTFDVLAEATNACGLADKNGNLMALCIASVGPILVHSHSSENRYEVIFWLKPPPSVAPDFLQTLTLVSMEDDATVGRLRASWRSYGSTSPTVQDRLITSEDRTMIFQVAVWIAVSNLTLADILGGKIRPADVGAALRVVGAAMRLVDRLGVDIKTRSVWKDRARIRNASDSAMQLWLKNIEIKP